MQWTGNKKASRDDDDLNDQDDEMKEELSPNFPGGQTYTGVPESLVTSSSSS